MTRTSTTRTSTTTTRGTTSRRRRLAALAGAGSIACTALALAAAPASADTPPTAHQQACDKAPWQARVQGEPKGFGPGAVSGDYLWHNGNGFHLRVTHAGSHDARVYTGVIHSSQPVRLEPVKLEGRDTVSLSADRRTISFSFENHGYIDGIDFHTDCARTLTLSELDVAGHPLPDDHIDLGYFSAHPAHVPFAVHRYSRTS